jgi:hypothetical protein
MVNPKREFISLFIVLEVGFGLISERFMGVIPTFKSI